MALMFVQIPSKYTPAFEGPVSLTPYCPRMLVPTPSAAMLWMQECYSPEMSCNYAI